MRAAVFHEPGPDRDLPLAGAGEIRVRILLRAGNPTGDGVGVVDALGEGVRGLEPGDRVWFRGADSGTPEEYVVLPLHRVIRMNDDIPFVTGAALGSLTPEEKANAVAAVAEAIHAKAVRKIVIDLS